MTPHRLPVIKQPAEATTLAFVFAELPLAGSLVSAVVLVQPRALVAPLAPLTAGEPLVTGSEVRVRVAGGTDGESYLVTVTATADDGDIVQSEAEVRVADLTFAAPDGQTPYVSVAAFVRRVGIDAAIRLTDELGTGRVDVARLGAALLDAQAIVDASLAQRFAVPLTEVPQLVAALVIDLALERLHGQVVPDGIARAADRATRLLRDIAEGRAALPGAAVAAATPSSPAPIFTQGPDRLFSRETMGGF